MITVSSIRDSQHCEVKVAARFLYEEEQTDAVFFLVVALCVAAAAEGNLKHLVSKATVHFVCPVNPVQRTKAELSLAQGGQRGLLKWHNMTALV